MLRKLAAYPRQNGLALALRELGRLERTLFIARLAQSPELRRRAKAGLNKGEARNALARAVFFNRLGEMRDRTFENQRYRASGLNLRRRRHHPLEHRLSRAAPSTRCAAAAAPCPTSSSRTSPRSAGSTSTSPATTSGASGTRPTRHARGPCASTRSPRYFVFKLAAEDASQHLSGLKGIPPPAVNDPIGRGMNELCPMPGCSIERITPDGPGFLHIAARGTRPGGRCPDCGRASRAVHSRYRRRPADLPSLGRAVGVELGVRRFYCRNAACARRTFAERLPELLGPRARRTRRLAEAQGRVGAALGGEGGARLLRHLAMPASADTVLRLVRGLPPPEPEPPRVVGVDDWAVRKGRTYGTILVDLERRRTLDLLPDRTADDARRLAAAPPDDRGHRARPLDRVRPRRRDGRAGGDAGRRPLAPAGQRAADGRALAGRGARPAPAPAGRTRPAGEPAARRARAYPRTRAEAAASADHRARRLAVYEEVRRRHLAGEALLAIGRATGLARGTVRKLAYARSFPERVARSPGPSILDPYLARLEARRAAGCENAMALWRELRALGFAGTHRQVQRWLADRRTAPAKSTPARVAPRAGGRRAARRGRRAGGAPLAEGARVAPRAAGGAAVRGGRRDRRARGAGRRGGDRRGLGAPLHRAGARLLRR